jgi:hypothetical protein
MKTETMPKSKLNIALFIGAFILTLLLVMLISRFGNPNPVDSGRNIFLKEGYDFRQKRLLNKDYSEPKFGSRISLVDLCTSKRQKVSNFLDGEMILLAVVDPDCAACGSSKDMVQNVRKNANEIGIKYLPIVFRKLPPDVDIQQYAETLGFETYIQWNSEFPAPESLRTMVTPSHILMNKDGVILQIWHGTNKDAATRIRMSAQISSDLYLINDVVNAIRTNNQNQLNYTELSSHRY